MFKHQLLSQLTLSKILSSVAVVTSVGFTVTSQLPVSAFSLTPVNTELSLLIDVSPSISRTEYALQMGAYRDAFVRLSPLFGKDGFGSVALNLIQWAGANSQQESIPWTLVNDQASALQLANTIDAIVRPSSFSSTAPGSAIQFAVPLFSSNNYEGQRWVIDVSGDGTQNSGVSTSMTRDAALAAGVSVINGLPILSPFTKPEDAMDASLSKWYAENIQGGVGSFVIPAIGFNDIGRALEQKLLLELTLPPVDSPVDPPVNPQAVPGPTNILGIALLGGIARLKRLRSTQST